MTNFLSKHVALFKNKRDCADVYCVTLIELQHFMCFGIRLRKLQLMITKHSLTLLIIR